MYLIRERLFDIGDDFDITDDSGRKVFHVDGKVLSLRDKLVIEDPAGRRGGVGAPPVGGAAPDVHDQASAARRPPRCART